MAVLFSDQKLLDSARRIARHLALVVDLPISVRLWDGSTIPLGRDADDTKCLVIAGAGVVGAMLRRARITGEPAGFGMSVCSPTGMPPSPMLGRNTIACGWPTWPASPARSSMAPCEFIKPSRPDARPRAGLSCRIHGHSQGTPAVGSRSFHETSESATRSHRLAI